MFLLRNRLGERFAADARNPEHDFDELRRRLEGQWREQWDRHRASDDNVSAADIRASIDRKIEHARERVERSMSPATRALFDHARRAHAADREAGYRDDRDANDDEQDSGA